MTRVSTGAVLSWRELQPDRRDIPALLSAHLLYQAAFLASDCYERQQILTRSSYLEEVAPPHQHKYVMKDAATQQSSSLEAETASYIFLLLYVSTRYFNSCPEAR